MSDLAAAAPAAKPRRSFTRSATPRPSPDQARRQGDVAREAWAVLGERAAVMRFLNDHHADLDGQPLALAIESDEGLERVRTALAAQRTTGEQA